MESISGLFFTGFCIFSVLSICRWIYLAYAHDGVGAYVSLSEQKTAAFLSSSLTSILKKQIELLSIIVCFVLFIYALCDGFLVYFSWVPDRYFLTLGDGSTIPLAVVLSCFVGICSSVVFGKWILIGICSYWEKQALAEQAGLYFDIIRQADNVDELMGIKKRIERTMSKAAETNRFAPKIVHSRLEVCARVIDLRIQDIEEKS